MDDFTAWLCVLLIVQAFFVLALGLYEIRRPTPEDQMHKHFGGV